ncbi:hypothetical protein GCM10010170_028300 [Dactylosporangium salmoneum]|uniref:HEAT repeat domain-containing protein n=1 Tax=Dactylosporangium salmoneum TaxID=53361 RepID=A0ABP5T1H2_9ACTN
MGADGEWRTAKVAALRSRHLSDALDAMLALAYYEPDRPWVEGLLRAATTPGNDPQIRRLAATCLGHVARIHGAVDAASVAALHQLLADPELSGTAEDALGDIESFAQLQVEGAGRLDGGGGGPQTKRGSGS